MAPGVAPAQPSEVGPPSPARRSKSGDSGEWVTAPAARERLLATGPTRFAERPFMNNPG